MESTKPNNPTPSLSLLTSIPFSPSSAWTPTLPAGILRNRSLSGVGVVGVAAATRPKLKDPNFGVDSGEFAAILVSKEKEKARLEGVSSSNLSRAVGQFFRLFGSRTVLNSSLFGFSPAVVPGIGEYLPESGISAGEISALFSAIVRSRTECVCVVMVAEGGTIFFSFFSGRLFSLAFAKLPKKSFCLFSSWSWWLILLSPHSSVDQFFQNNWYESLLKSK